MGWVREGGCQLGTSWRPEAEVRRKVERKTLLNKIKKNTCNNRKHTHQFDKQPTAHATAVFFGGGRGFQCEKLWLVLFMPLMVVPVLFVTICVFPGVKLICVSVVCFSI